VRILSVGHEQKEVVNNLARVRSVSVQIVHHGEKKQGYDHLSGMFDSTAKTPCLTQPTLQFSGGKIKLLTKKNSDAKKSSINRKVLWRIARALLLVRLRDTQLVKGTQK
jgi:hypothetical protein